MKAQSTIAKGERIGSTWLAAAGGAVVILVLASGLGLGLGAVVNRLTMPDQAAGALSGGPSRPTTVVSTARVADRSSEQLPPLARVWGPHVVDRWYDEPAAATRTITTNFGDGGIQSSVQFVEIAPDELLLMGR